MAKIKVGIVGFGRMGITHYSILNPHQDVQIVAITDPSKIVLTLLKKYAGHLKLYSEYEEMLNSGNLDAIFVCVPPALHYPVIKYAGNLGIHVFSEKPFTTKSEYADELTNLFQEKGLINQVGYVNRYNDVFNKAKKLICSNAIGSILRFKSEMFSCTVLREESNGWRSSRDGGGGVVYEMASHAIDLVLYLIGKPDKVLGTVMNRIYSKNVEDIISTTLLYQNGITGTIYVNWSDSSYRKPTNKIEVFGTEGKIIADQHSLKVFSNKKNSILELNEGWNTFYITDLFHSVPFYVRGNEFTSQLYDFVDCIKDKNKSCLCKFSDGAMTLEIIDSMFKDYLNNSKI